MKFGWVDAHTLYALQAVDNLRAKRTKAPEYRKVKPVDAETVEKTLPFMPPIVADMVRIQRLCGMRPQDIRNMRSCDIDQTGEIWRYVPFTHTVTEIAWRSKSTNSWLQSAPFASCVLGAMAFPTVKVIGLWLAHAQCSLSV